MMPNDPVTGGTVLRRAAIQSPNYVAGVSGWAINADGTAQFNAIDLPNGQGVSVFIQGTAPATTHTGDLWYNTSDGLALSQWNGTEWVPYQIGTGAIASSAITTALIAAQAVTAAEIANGTITAEQISAVAGILGSQLDANAGITGGQLADLTVTVNKFQSQDHYLF